jgi:hypothetical protein
MHATSRTLATTMLTLLLAACSGGGGGSGSTSTPSNAVDREQYAERLAGWLCDDLAACCSAGASGFDRAECVAVKTKSELHRLASEESHGVRAFDGAVASECLAALAETPASCGYERRVRRCFQTYDGLADLGAACSGKVACRGSASGDVACVDGVCTARLATGQECPALEGTDSCDVCRADARCRLTTDGTRQCIAYERRSAGLGERCFDGAGEPYDPADVIAAIECADGLRCSLDGVCAAPVPVGGACVITFDCAAGARCADDVCVVGLGAGEQCKGSRECASGLYCDSTETCLERDPVTGVCRSSRNDGGTCAPQGGVGASCDRFDACAGELSCRSSGAASGDAGTCVAPPDACTAGLDKLARQAAR